jgi:hypothetical protein
MKPKPNKRIDNLLGKLGLHPHSVDPDELTAELNPFASAPHTPITGLCGKTCYPSESAARKCGKLIKKRGANTSFLRSYFCSQCKAWHLTSAKNVGTSKSSGTTRNAGRNRRNHHQTPPTHES